MQEYVFTLLIIAAVIVALGLWVHRLRRVTINTDGRAPFFGPNAITWVLSLTVAIGVMWLIKEYALPILEPYNASIAHFIATKLGL